MRKNIKKIVTLGVLVALTVARSWGAAGDTGYIGEVKISDLGINEEEQARMREFGITVQDFLESKAAKLSMSLKDYLMLRAENRQANPQIGKSQDKELRQGVVPVVRREPAVAVGIAGIIPWGGPQKLSEEGMGEPRQGEIVVASLDGHRFYISHNIAHVSLTLHNLLGDLGEELVEIPVPNINGSILNNIIKLIKQDQLSGAPVHAHTSIADVAKLVVYINQVIPDLDADNIMSYIEAASYLDLPNFFLRAFCRKFVELKFTEFKGCEIDLDEQKENDLKLIKELGAIVPELLSEIAAELRESKNQTIVLPVDNALRGMLIELGRTHVRYERPARGNFEKNDTVVYQITNGDQVIGQIVEAPRADVRFFNLLIDVNADGEREIRSVAGTDILGVLVFAGELTDSYIQNIKDELFLLQQFFGLAGNQEHSYYKITHMISTIIQDHEKSERGIQKSSRGFFNMLRAYMTHANNIFQADDSAKLAGYMIPSGAIKLKNGQPYFDQNKSVVACWNSLVVPFIDRLNRVLGRLGIPLLGQKVFAEPKR